MHRQTGSRGVGIHRGQTGSYRHSHRRRHPPTDQGCLVPNLRHQTIHRHRYRRIRIDLLWRCPERLGKRQVGRQGLGCRHSHRHPYRPIESLLTGTHRQYRLLGPWCCSRRCPHQCLQTNSRRLRRFGHELRRCGCCLGSKRRRKRCRSCCCCSRCNLPGEVH